MKKDKIVWDKIHWILKQHKRIGQKYGDLPYHVHLQDVAKFAEKPINLPKGEYVVKIQKEATGGKSTQSVKD